MTAWNLGPVSNGLGTEVTPETGWIWLIKNFTYVLGTLAGCLSSKKVALGVLDPYLLLIRSRMLASSHCLVMALFFFNGVGFSSALRSISLL